MKRPNSSNSHISIFPSSPPGEEEKKMDDDDCTGEDDLCSSGHAAEKKRRLSSDQVRALEKSFEVENKLDPERKLRLAQELSLQPRQVAVWFQNRRARWKTKLLERDYAALTTSYDALRQDLDSLRRDNQALASEIKELKAKLGEEESYSSEETPPPLTAAAAAAAEYNTKPSETLEAPATAAGMIYKDGSSDSDTSAVVNDEISPYQSMFASSPAIISTNSPTFTISAPKAASQIWGSGATSARVSAASGFTSHHQLKTEEQGFNCFFSDEQPLYYYPDQWSWMDGGGDHGNFVSKEGLS